MLMQLLNFMPENGSGSLSEGSFITAEKRVSLIHLTAFFFFSSSVFCVYVGCEMTTLWSRKVFCLISLLPC